MLLVTLAEDRKFPEPLVPTGGGLAREYALDTSWQPRGTPVILTADSIDKF